MCASAASGRPRPRPAVLCGPVPSRRGGGRGSPEGAVIYHWHVFQPALPARGATAFAKAAGMCLIFQPALPAKGATSSWLLRDCGGQISIHVPREGSDTPESMLEGKLEYISTHAPYEGSDVIGFKGCRVLGQFQPTLPVRGATSRIKMNRSYSTQFQSTLPVRRATPTTLSGVPVKSSFQSTLPVRGATANLHKINAEILAECLIILRKTEKRGQKACIGWTTKAKKPQKARKQGAKDTQNP